MSSLSTMAKGSWNFEVLYSANLFSILKFVGRYCEGLPQQLCFPHCGGVRFHENLLFSHGMFAQCIKVGFTGI